jgi:hypothetical protein
MHCKAFHDIDRSRNTLLHGKCYRHTYRAYGFYEMYVVEQLVLVLWTVQPMQPRRNYSQAGICGKMDI